MASTTRRGFVAGLLSLPFVSKLLGKTPEPDESTIDTMLWGDTNVELARELDEMRARGITPISIVMSPEVAMEFLKVRRSYVVGRDKHWAVQGSDYVFAKVRYDLFPNQVIITGTRSKIILGPK